MMFSMFCEFKEENKPGDPDTNCKRDGLHASHYRKYPKKVELYRENMICNIFHALQVFFSPFLRDRTYI